ncbi:hydrolase, alpha/beta fold family protein [Roseovarius nubinhibens ISM]|uniref:Hydrolase, alpha/beta fold family protein n=2 Tax=Roseovarius nubinhibens TaxID=314263 RepID=A3SRP1_ROSNI|nr:hydrolase, alpha/beta fold family protein [Roseovarius nubinhibens ISM]
MMAGVETHWTEFGRGPRGALLIHCSLAHGGSWAGVARRLSERLAMRAFDLPGHGRSADWGGETELQGLSAEIAASLAAEMGGGAPVDVIGHSFGATVGLRLALERPELVRSLTLIEPVFFALALADQPGLDTAFEGDTRAITAGLASGDHAAAARAFTALWGDGTEWDTIPEPQQRRLADQMHLIAGSGPALYEDAGGMLRPGRIEAIACPVLLMEGGASPAIIPAILDGIAARLPQAERVVVEGAGHMLPITHPEPVAEAIGALLSRS